ncbi:hypothetical protein DPEC_G00165110 [Dallia pectoralis]|uniref:Uncharacterized protein n=1 Tax=Dallia pectoralis TaxID=75939 RepID=A0ACC2GH08_DALPE|nr:hypothetical protein DPEC_G00165110 [Dallia pectoralis]
MLSAGQGLQLGKTHRVSHTLPRAGTQRSLRNHGTLLLAVLILVFLPQGTALPNDYRHLYNHCPGPEWNVMCRGCCEYDVIRCKCPLQGTPVGYAVPCCRNALNECDPCIIHPGCSIFENCKRCNNGTWGPRDDFFVKGKYCAECRPGWSGGDCMQCGGMIHKRQGHIVLESYPTNARCEWTIQVDPPFTIDFRFMMLSLEFDHSCRYDYIEVRDGDSIRSQVIGRFCGNDRPVAIQSSGNYLHVLFVSDGYKNFDGFFAIFQESSACSSSPCLHDGTCILDSSHSYHCACLAGYTGPRCENVVGCRRPPVPVHGSTEGVFHHSGAQVTFHCDPGYELKGTLTAICLLDGTWSAPVPRCVPTLKFCGIPAKPVHGDHFLVYGPNDVLIALQYLCYRPYKLSGVHQRTCLPNNTWSGTPPTCDKVNNTLAGPDKDKDKPKYIGKDDEKYADRDKGSETDGDIPREKDTEIDNTTVRKNDGAGKDPDTGLRNTSVDSEDAEDKNVDVTQVDIPGGSKDGAIDKGEDGELEKPSGGKKDQVESNETDDISNTVEGERENDLQITRVDTYVRPDTRGDTDVTQEGGNRTEIVVVEDKEGQDEDESKEEQVDGSSHPNVVDPNKLKPRGDTFALDETELKPRGDTFALDETELKPRGDTFALDETELKPRGDTFALDETELKPRGDTFALDETELKPRGDTFAVEETELKPRGDTFAVEDPVLKPRGDTFAVENIFSDAFGTNEIEQGINRTMSKDVVKVIFSTVSNKTHFTHYSSSQETEMPMGKPGKDVESTIDTGATKDKIVSKDTKMTTITEATKDTPVTKDPGKTEYVKATTDTGLAEDVIQGVTKITEAPKPTAVSKDTRVTEVTEDTAVTKYTAVTKDTGSAKDTAVTKDTGSAKDTAVTKDADVTGPTGGAKDTVASKPKEETKVEGEAMPTKKEPEDEDERENQSISEKSCPPHGHLYHGYQQVVPGLVPETVEFSCNHSYALIGDSRRICQPGGTWAGTQPLCVRACREPKVSELVRQTVLPPHVPFRKTPVHKFYSSSGFGRLFKAVGPTKRPPVLAQLPQGFQHLYTHIEYECASPFYHHTGSARRTCLKTGKWSGRHVSCSPVCGKHPTFDPQKPVESHWPWLAAIYRRSTDGAGNKLHKKASLAEFHKPKTVDKAGIWAGPEGGAEGQDEASTWQLVCSGALVNQRTVVVAAHCVTELGKLYPLDAAALKVVMGKHYRSDRRETKGLQHLRVASISVHPNYDPLVLDSDIAVVKLLDKARIGEKVLPICLPDTQGGELTTKQGLVTGWAPLPDPRIGVDERARVGVQHLADVVPCEQQYARSGVPVSVTDNMLCGRQRPDYSPSNICPADTGGVLIIPAQTGSARDLSTANQAARDQSKGEWRLLGLVSFGYDEGECDPDLFTVYTHVAHFKDWIERHMK